MGQLHTSFITWIGPAVLVLSQLYIYEGDNCDVAVCYRWHGGFIITIAVTSL